MKKIAFLSPTGTFDNGAEISIFYLMKVLKAEGYQVINVAPASFPHLEKSYREQFATIDVPVFFLPRNKWWWEEAPGLTYGTAGERAASYRDNIAQIRQLLVSEKVDLLITNTVNMFQGAVAAACEDLPHFWLIHEFPENEFAYYLDKLDFVAENSEAVFAVKGQLTTDLQQKLPSKVVRSFIPYTEVSATTPQKGQQRRIVSVGRLTPRKNQLELLEAYHRLSEPRPPLVFIGAWDDEYKKKVDAYIRSHHLKDVSFTGGKADPWVEVKDQDLCVLPSAMETFGLVYAEALLKGVPVIFSDNPGHLSAYDHFGGGHLYPSGDIAALQKQLTAVLADFPQAVTLAKKQAKSAREKYQPAIAYGAILEGLQTDLPYQPKPLRHLAAVLSLNEEKSRLTRTEKRVRQFSNRGKAWLKRRFGNSDS